MFTAIDESQRSPDEQLRQEGQRHEQLHKLSIEHQQFQQWLNQPYTQELLKTLKSLYEKQQNNILILAIDRTKDAEQVRLEALKAQASLSLLTILTNPLSETLKLLNINNTQQH